jgi:hypothetical protein
MDVGWPEQSDERGASLYVIDVGNRAAREILRIAKPERLHDCPEVTGMDA